MYQLNLHFIFKNQDDKEIKKIIEQDSFTNELIVHDVNIKSLHRNFYRSRTDQNFRNKYTEGSKKILDEFQTMEEKYIEFTKESFRKYFEYQNLLSI